MPSGSEHSESPETTELCSEETVIPTAVDTGYHRREVKVPHQKDKVGKTWELEKMERQAGQTLSPQRDESMESNVRGTSGSCVTCPSLFKTSVTTDQAS